MHDEILIGRMSSGTSRDKKRKKRIKLATSALSGRSESFMKNMRKSAMKLWIVDRHIKLGSSAGNELHTIRSNYSSFTFSLSLSLPPCGFFLFSQHNESRSTYNDAIYMPKRIDMCRVVILRKLFNHFTGNSRPQFHSQSLRPGPIVRGRLVVATDYIRYSLAKTKSGLHPS